jgi:hypothetical protein
MSTRFEPCVSIEFDSCTVDEIATLAKDWALLHGIYNLIF